jgi:Ca2+-binding RTX toxin-like protein
MASPTVNSVGITHLNVSGLPNTEGSLIDGGKWGGGYGTGASLTYSFLTGTAWHETGYGTHGEPGSRFDLTETQRSAVRLALDTIARSVNLSFTEVGDGQYTVGELRFAGTYNTTAYAHAYTPANGQVESGDVWFSDEWYAKPVSRGSFGFTTILHEIGHALGLKHPFEPGNTGQTLDSTYTHTIMSYSPVAGELTDTVTASLYPTTFMFSDLLALEKLYGAPTHVNTGNTTYTFYDNQIYWQTIVDGGGTDTVKYISSSSGAHIDLSNASFTQMGLPVEFSNGQINYDTIAFGPSTVIEHATGGGGNDTLIGNFKANKLTGNGGDDELVGADGDDNLIGGAGSDEVEGGAGNDKITWGSGDTVDGGAGTDILKLTASEDLVPLTQKILGIEQLDLRGGASSILTLNRADVLDLSPTTNNIRVLGDAGDSVDIAGPFTRGALAGGFRTYKLGSGAILTIETDVVVS